MAMPTDLRELFRILWQRKWFFLVPAALVMAAAISVIFALPPLYRSQATLLIESQEIPENVVPSLITEQIDRRLEVITREVLATDNLLEIADRHNLYAEERDTLQRQAIAARMRDRIETQTLVTEINNERTGRRTQATLGFEISFLDASPRKARLVTNDLVNSYLSNNLEGRRAVAETTTDFLANEREQLDQRITKIEDDLTRFKMANRELLPGEAEFKRQQLNNIQQQLRSLETDLRVLGERESYLSTQLALIDEFEASGGRGDNTPEARLELLRSELATARARYSPGHPDVIRLQREVRSLRDVVGTRAGSSSLAEEEAMLEADLAALRQRYTGEHPDVQRVQRELVSVREALRNEDGGAPIAGASRNASYVQLSAQLNSVQAEISAIKEQQTRLQEERVALQEQLAHAPEVELEYNRLVRQLENAVADRNALADKEAAARLSGSLESTAAGEQLSLMEPPTAPNSPASPNKKLILAAGLVLAVGSGGTSLLLAQLLDRSIRSGRDVFNIIGDSPLVAIPIITTAADRYRKWSWRVGIAAVVLIVLVGGLTWVHQRIVPLDLLGYEVANRAEQWIGPNERPPAGESPLTETQ